MTSETVPHLNYGVMFMGLAGGLALFLFGMRNLTDSLKTVAGSRMKQVLGKLTQNRFTGAIAGALITAVIQSSSITTVLVVGFVSTGLLSLGQSVGVILGANVGTTITAQIIAFKITKYALLMIAAGFVLELVSKKPVIRHYGSIIIGLGLLFLGMEFMADATSPLRNYSPFLEFVKGMHNPLIGVVVGAGFTALVQSSSATTGIVIVMSGQGLIPLEAGIALVFGANIGTCVTALLSAIGKPTEAFQTALVHVLFKVCGVLIWIFFIPQFAEIVRNISPVSEHLEGLARISVETPRQIANAHTLFNIINVLIFIWFTPWIARMVTAIVPKRTREATASYQAKYLDPYYLESPAAALGQVRLELHNLGNLAADMVRQGIPAAINGTKLDLDILKDQDNNVDALHGQILAFLARLSTGDLDTVQSQNTLQYISIANYIENLGDLVETDISRDGKHRIENNLTISADTSHRLEQLHKKASSAVDLAIGFIKNPDHEKISDLLLSKDKFSDEVKTIRAYLVQRLAAEEPERVETFRLETNFIEYINRMHIIARRITRVVVSLDAGTLKRGDIRFFD